MFDLTGKAALVTGAARGIGKAIAVGLAANGAKVSLADINEDALKEAVAEIGADKAMYVLMNVGDNDSIEAGVKKTADAYGGIDIVVNSAGILGQECNA